MTSVVSRAVKRATHPVSVCAQLSVEPTLCQKFKKNCVSGRFLDFLSGINIKKIGAEKYVEMYAEKYVETQDTQGRSMGHFLKNQA